MNAPKLAALGLLLIAAAPPPPSGAVYQQALANYRALLAGQKQLSDLSPRDRLAVIELERWLRSTDEARASETREACIERLQSRTPSQLESALLDLKCSQRR